MRDRSRWFVYASTIGRLVSCLSEKCYPISVDAAQIVAQFFGFEERKVSICSLGVDTDLFKPASDEASQQVRARLRQQLGFGQSDIVCIYTGRFTEDKGPVSLAQAVGRLVAQGEPFRGLFVGAGPRADVAAIQACPGCVTHSFVPARELPQFYWAADIGVWPKQESTSQLDAACCGLPIIVSDRVQARERIEGNGFTYLEGDVRDLARKIKTLADANLRRRMGHLGRKRMEEQFSWNTIASQRVRDYEAALQR